MRQTIKGSTVETISNVGTGYFIGFILNLTFLPLLVVQITNQDMYTALLIGGVYTGVSMIRSFIFRRAFNKRT